MTTAQSLDRVIAISRASASPNEFNEPVYEWVTLFTCRASRRDASDGERFASGQIGAFRQSRFIVRSSQNTRSILPSDLLLHEGRQWNIVGLKERDEGRRRFIEITATVSADG